MTVANVQVTQVLFKRGNTALAQTYIGPLGEAVLDTGLGTLRLQDGVTPGGRLMATAAQANAIVGGSTYGNANVAAYLPTYSGNITAGNTRTGNIFTNNYFYANGAPFVSSNYSNVDVASYLPTYSGNITAGNVLANRHLYANGVNILTSINNSILASNSAIATLQTQVYSNANVATYLPSYAGSISGTITTATQPNINQLGVLNSLATAGDATINGNLTVTGNINFIGNVTNQTVTGNSGQFFGNASGFGALYAGIGTGYLNEPQMAFQVATNFNGYSGMTMQNINSGSQASSVLSILPNNGSLLDTYIAMGIGSSNFSYPGYSLLGRNDAFINVSGNSVTGSGNLVLVTTTFTDIVFATASREVMRITAGNVVQIQSNTASTSATSGALTVAGGVGVSGTVTVANTVVVQGVDLLANVSSLANQIVTANTAMKGYVDTQITTVTTAWTANAGAQATELVNLDLKIIAANTYANNNVTGANAAIQSLNANIGSYYIYANANVAGLQGQIIGANIAWQANAATQQGLIQATSANIGSYYTYANANVAGLQGQIVGANSSIQSLSANIGSYYTYANANVAGLQGQITGANSSIQSLSANVGSFYTYANTTFVTTSNSYGNGNVAAYLSGYSGNVTAGNVITNNYRFANGAPLSFSTLASGAYTANLTTGGVLQAPAVQSDGTITTQGPVVLTYSGASNTLYKIAAVDVNNLAIYGTRNTYFDTTLLTLNAVGGNATVSGNVVAPNYLFANGVNILSTVGAGSYGNTQVAQFLPTYTGNVSAGNAAVTAKFTVPFGVSQTATDIQRIILAQALIA